MDLGGAHLQLTGTLSKDGEFYHYPSDRTRYVDPGGTNTLGNLGGNTGGPDSPYRTIQFAVNDIETNLSPSATSPAAVVVRPGNYDETVLVLKNGVGIVGTGGQGLCQIKPTAGPSLILSNAQKTAVVGTVNLTSLTYGAGSSLAGLTISLAIDGGSTVSHTFAASTPTSSGNLLAILEFVFGGTGRCSQILHQEW